jgi:iron only hydrogenase large subunit-like protein
MFDRIKENPSKYAFVEVMACTGGCVNGGGQPVVNASVQEKVDVRQERAKALYTIDKDLALRKSHKNPEVNRLYKEFLIEPGSHIAHHLLHTFYKSKNTYSKI